MGESLQQPEFIANGSIAFWWSCSGLKCEAWSRGCQPLCQTRPEELRKGRIGVERPKPLQLLLQLRSEIWMVLLQATPDQGQNISQRGRITPHQQLPLPLSALEADDELNGWRDHDQKRILAVLRVENQSAATRLAAERGVMAAGSGQCDGRWGQPFQIFWCPDPPLQGVEQLGLVESW